MMHERIDFLFEHENRRRVGQTDFSTELNSPFVFYLTFVFSIYYGILCY